MKLVVTWLIVLVIIALQVSIGQSFGGGVFAAPLSLLAIVVLANFVSTEQLLYIALVSGVLIDVSSGVGFGYNIVLYLLIALFCKLAMRFGQREKSLTTILLLSGLITLLYNFLQFVGIFSVDHILEIGTNITRVSLQIVFSLAWVIVFYYLFGYIDQLRFSFQKTKLKILRR